MELAIALYTISDDGLRKEFTEALESQGFEKHPDQSTYTFPMDKVGYYFRIDRLSIWFASWAKDKEWDETDFIEIYYLAPVRPNSDFMAIKSKKLI